MEDYKVSNKGSATLFKNPILEKLTRTNFYVPVILFLVLGIAASAYGYLKMEITIVSTLLLYLGGVFVFSLVEYLIHRFLFHFEAHTPQQKELKYKIHGVHHHFPKDKDRLAMPPVMSLALASVFYLIFMITLGKYGYPFFGGFVSGYSVYLIIHYAVHRFRQPRNFLKILWKHHSLHHYRSEDTAFGVSNPMWDYLFGTLPDRKSIKIEDREQLPDYAK
jgi:sterol desaturase/sphingolipid hydroxylase (fatty acid hydroxylase superfamily)